MAVVLIGTPRPKGRELGLPAMSFAGPEFGLSSSMPDRVPRPRLQADIPPGIIFPSRRRLRPSHARDVAIAVGPWPKGARRGGSRPRA